MSSPRTSRRSIAIDADGDDDGHQTMWPLWAPSVGRMDPQVGLVALDRPAQERLHLLVDLVAQPATWLLEMPLIPIALTSSSTERVETPCT